MKKTIALFLVSMLVLSGCKIATLEGENVKELKPVKKAENQLVVGVSLSTLNNPFFVSVKEGISDLAKEHDTTVKIVDAQDDSVKQSNDITDLIQQNVDVLLINPVDSFAIAPAVESANQANIPVIAIDRSSESGKLLSLVASNNSEGGKMAGEYLERVSGKKALVGELQGVPGASATRERGKGFEDYAKEHLTVVAKQTANFDRAKGLTVMENMLQSNPEVTAIFAQNDEMALGAIEAIEAAGKKEIKVIGFDGTEDGLKAIKSGKLDATVAQKPTEMGRLALQTAYDFFNLKDVKAKVDSPLELIEKSK